MKEYFGKENCGVHGDFDWRYVNCRSGEVVVGPLNNLNLNVRNVRKFNDRLHIEVKCPYCGCVKHIDYEL